MPIPDDLLPIPTQPWDQRPVELPLDPEEVRTAIWRTNGNISAASALIKVPSNRLRRFIANSPRLSREIEESREQIVDIAEGVVRDALRDPDRADPMARFVLGTMGRKRGWGQVRVILPLLVLITLLTLLSSGLMVRLLLLQFPSRILIALSRA